jgi:hypothetical protein
MSLGAWIFLSVLLLLVVLHKQFRKIFFWTAGIAAVCVGIFAGYFYVKERLEEKRQKAEHAAYLKRVDECVTRLTPPGVKQSWFLDGATPASVCSDNPDITQSEATAQHSPVTVPIPEGGTAGWSVVPRPKRKPTPVEPKNWALVKGDYVSIYSRCHFEAGTKKYDSNACGVFDKETIAELKKGDRVAILSGLVRSSGGADIYEVRFQRWTGWVEATDLAIDTP